MKIRSIVLSTAVALLTLSSCKVKTGSARQSSNRPEEKLGWQLGAQAYTFNRFSFTEALNKIDSCGLKYVEAFPGQEIGGGIKEKMNYSMSASSMAYVKKLLVKKDIKWVSYGVIKANSSEEWRKVFAFAKEMGVKTITCEPDVKDMAVISSLCDEFQLNAALHNHPKPSYYWSPDVVIAAIKGQSKRVGACADIGHWVRSGLDPVACLKQLEGRVYQLHFKDLNERNNVKAHDVHWGTGVSNIAGVIAELKRQNFKGMLSAEYEYNWNNNMPDVKASALNFREMVSK